MKVKIKKKVAKVIRKRKTPVKLTRLQWEEVRELWIRGGVTFSELATHFDVAKNKISNRSSDEDWAEQKRTHWAEARRRLRERVLEMFVEAGLPPERLVRMICKGAIETTKLQNIKSERITITRKNTKGKLIKLRPFTLDETQELTDNDNTLKYRELAIKLLDMFPAAKTPQKEEQEEFLPVVSHINKVEKEE